MANLNVKATIQEARRGNPRNKVFSGVLTCKDDTQKEILGITTSIDGPAIDEMIAKAMEAQFREKADNEALAVALPDNVKLSAKYKTHLKDKYGVTFA